MTKKRSTVGYEISYKLIPCYLGAPCTPLNSYFIGFEWGLLHNRFYLLSCQFSVHEQCNEIRKMNSNIVVIGKTTVDNDKEDLDNDPDDDDADNVEESEGEEFEQETG
uniref:Uncharacterized protein n=1 Tax=Daucus carota subsp. sativus TaxID=79200 RepID=A0A166DLQ6_DAUCS